MTWSKTAWQQIAPIYAKIERHPFIAQLINGSLDQKIFEFYVKQDLLYLIDFGKILSGINLQLTDSKHISHMLQCANDMIAAEKDVYANFLANKDQSQIEASPSCLLYTSFLYKQFTTKPVEVSMAAVLPCFWIYNEVGRYIYSHDISPTNPYFNWISNYAGDEYTKIVATTVNICDTLATKTTSAIRDEMTNAFVLCSKMEWMFWDSAYSLEKWPI